MKSALALVSGLALALTACASNKSRVPTAAERAAAMPVADPDARLQRFRVRSWTAVDDQTLIVTATDGTRYRAETFGPCLGMNYTNRVAFETRGGFEQIDRFSSVVLADGTRCQFRAFGKLKAPELKALDDYEKAPEKPDADDTGDSSSDGQTATDAGAPANATPGERSNDAPKK